MDLQKEHRYFEQWLGHGQVRLTQEELSIVPYAAGTKKRQNSHVITIEFL